MFLPLPIDLIILSLIIFFIIDFALVLDISNNFSTIFQFILLFSFKYSIIFSSCDKLDGNFVLLLSL